MSESTANQKVYPVAIIGGGSAGTMALLRGVLNNDQVLFFPGAAKERKKSRAQWVSKVDNIPAHHRYKRGILEPNKETLEWIEASEFCHNLIWKKNLSITSLQKNDQDLFVLTDSKGEVYLSRFVVLCTGVMDRQPEIDGKIDAFFPFANLQSIDYCLRCDGHHTYKKDTAVIGHDLSAAWVAIMLYERYQNPSMTILTNAQEAQFDDQTQELIKKYGINVNSKKIQSIIGQSKQGQLEGFILEDNTKVQSQIAFVSLGMLVYNQLALELKANCDERGFVVCDSKGESSIPGLYVAGDLRANAKKQIYTAWDHAVDSMDAINAKLRRMKRENS